MKALKHLFLLMFCVSAMGSFPTETETKMLLHMRGLTKIKNFVLAPDERLGRAHLKIFKFLAKEKQFFTLILMRKDLRAYLEKVVSNEFSWTIVTFRKTNASFDNYFSDKRMMTSYFWIIYDESDGDVIDDLMDYYIPLNCAMLIMKKISENHYMVNEFYKIKKGPSGVINKFGEYRDGRVVQTSLRWYDRKSDLKGFNFTTVKYKEDLYISPRIKANEEIWKELATLLNFTISDKLIEYVPEQVLEIDSDEEEEEEAFLDPQIYIKSTKKDKFLLGPTAESKLYIHVRVTGEYAGFARIVRPFSNGLWLGTGLWVTLSALVTFSFEYAYERFYRRRKNWNKLILMMFVPLYSLCSQSGLRDDRAFASSKVLLFLMRISAYFQFCAYSATLLSYILLYIPVLPFTDLKGFVEDGSYKIEGERNSEVDAFFKISPDPLERLVYEKFMNDPKTWTRFDKGLDRMCKGEKLVLIGFDNDIDRYTPCPIVKIRKPFRVFASGFKLRPKSPFKEFLQIKLMLLKTTGILRKINEQILFGSPNKYQTNSPNTNYEIKLGKVVPIFIVFVWGISLSVVVLVVEIVYSNVNRERNRKQLVTLNEDWMRPTRRDFRRRFNGRQGYRPNGAADCIRGLIQIQVF